ncbi:hypothetical protein ABZX83_14615 [Streptomyces thermoviolaceus]|uniref:hypothetical protein n=1 Tax=Streptomyces thermoviolaceus TaxID=1952 RepID=UPI0033ABC644
MRPAAVLPALTATAFLLAVTGCSSDGQAADDLKPPASSSDAGAHGGTASGIPLSDAIGRLTIAPSTPAATTGMPSSTGTAGSTPTTAATPGKSC